MSTFQNTLFIDIKTHLKLEEKKKKKRKEARMLTIETG